jgi:hypothetical protein
MCYTLRTSVYSILHTNSGFFRHFTSGCSSNAFTGLYFSTESVVLHWRAKKIMEETACATHAQRILAFPTPNPRFFMPKRSLFAECNSNNVSCLLGTDIPIEQSLAASSDDHRATI